MSTRHLDALFDPASVVVVGASARPDSVGAVAWRNVRAGPFRGAVFAVNPKLRRLDGQSVYSRIADLPAPADLALLCTPAADAAAQIAELGAHGTRAAIVLASDADAAQRQAMLDAARPHMLRVLGPGCVGMLLPHLGLNASITPTDALAGDLAFVSQSGSLCSAMLDWARSRGIGFSHVLSLGGHADIDAGDLLDQLASDSRARSILLYLEAIQAPRKFLSAARAAARNKPVIVLRSPHALPPDQAGDDRAYDAAIQRAGMLRVHSLPQMFLAAQTLARFRGNRSEQLAVLSNGAGAAALAVDAAAREGVALCHLQAQTLQQLQPLLSREAVPGAPLLLPGRAAPQTYAQALQRLQDDPGKPAPLVIHAPVAQVASAQVAHALRPREGQAAPRLMGCWLGHDAVAGARDVFQQAGIASYTTPDEAVSAFSMLVHYRRNQAQLIEAPPSRGSYAPANAATARALVQRALGAGRTLLEADEARELLAAYGIAVRATRQVQAEPYAAASAAERIGYPVSLQLVGAGLPDPADSGTPRQDLRSAVQVHDAAQRLLRALRRARPGARAEGLRVTASAEPAHARALTLGARIDALFGPVILLGTGATALDGVPGATVALPPLNVPLARSLMHRSGAMARLRGDDDTPPADEAALQRVLVGLSQLLIDVSQVAEVDCGPLLVGSDGALATRARVRLSLAAPAGALNFAIRPYPSNLVETLDWQGRRLTVRPIRPEDETQHMDFLGRLAPADIRMRVFYARRSIERSELARLTQVDYAREMAFVAVEADDEGAEHTLAVVRAIADADNQNAEFGIVVRSDLKGARLGELLMSRIIDYQRGQGTQKLVATVLGDNIHMLGLARRLGFEERASDEGNGVRWIELALQR
ncbi:MAG: acetate--CoA ligase family protein [Rubrivivax sp.]|nr:acetate--CoA ligase family protein [Rubrivivax sp.]